MRLIPGVLGNEASGEFESFGVADAEITRMWKGSALTARRWRSAGLPALHTTGRVWRAACAGGAAERKPPADSPLAPRATVAQDVGQPPRPAGKIRTERRGSQAAGSDPSGRQKKTSQARYLPGLPFCRRPPWLRPASVGPHYGDDCDAHGFGDLFGVSLLPLPRCKNIAFNRFVRSGCFHGFLTIRDSSWVIGGENVLFCSPVRAFHG